jgi:phosphoglycerate dehydrogenase-like enzyme
MKSILVSPFIEASHGAELRAIAAGRLDVRAFEPGYTGLADVDVAFLSADYMDKGAVAADNPVLAAFLDAISSAPSLRWTHICSAGADRDVLRQMMARGVTVTTSSGANARSVANAAIAGMLALERDVPQWVTEKAAHRWTPRNEVVEPAELEGARVTIIGMGPIGVDIARVCKALGMHVTGLRRSAGAADFFDEVHPTDALPQVLPRTDWLVIACPLTPQTRGLVSAEALAALPRHARLINIARGPIVDEPALNAALRSGALAGAYCDVFHTEPLPASSPLWDAPNLLMSPHTAGRSTGFGPRAAQMFKANLERWLADEPLHHIAN